MDTQMYIIGDDIHTLLQQRSLEYTNNNVQRAFLAWHHTGYNNNFRDVCDYYYRLEAMNRTHPYNTKPNGPQRGESTDGGEDLARAYLNDPVTQSAIQLLASCGLLDISHSPFYKHFSFLSQSYAQNCNLKKTNSFCRPLHRTPEQVISDEAAWDRFIKLLKLKTKIKVMFERERGKFPPRSKAFPFQ